jgi:hypothetical protein
MAEPPKCGTVEHAATVDEAGSAVKSPARYKIPAYPKTSPIEGIRDVRSQATA